MTLNKIASEIAKREGKKSQARIGDIREILKLLVKQDVEVGGETPDSWIENLLVIAYEKGLKAKPKKVKAT